MARYPHKYLTLLVITLSTNLVQCLYEDQIGKFDWKKSYIGKVKYSVFDYKRVIVATEENVLASLNVKTGAIQWRQVLENPNEGRIQLLHVDREIVTVLGAKNNWNVRIWDSTGTIVSSCLINNSDKVTHSEFFVDKNRLVQVIPAVNSHLEVITYALNTGESKSKYRVSAPWIRDISNCVLTKPHYVCMSSEDSLGKLYYTNVLQENSSTQQKSLQSLIGDGIGRVLLIDYKYKLPAFLVLRNNIAKLVIIQEHDLEVKQFNLMPNAVYVEGNKPQIYQLEAGDDPGKLIRVKGKDAETGQDEFSLDLEYPLGLGAPIILDAQARGSSIDLLLSTTDEALLLVKLPEGKILWTREEALGNIVATEFFELPVSELDASIEHEFDPAGDILSMFIHRISTQAKQLTTALFGGQMLSQKGLVRDDFGLHQIIVVATKVGKIFALDTISGSIVWSYRLPNIRPFYHNEKILMFVQRTARYAPLPAQCVLFAEDSISGKSVMFQFDPITGYSEDGITKLNYHVKQALLLPHPDDKYLKPIITVSDTNQPHIYPESAIKTVQQYLPSTYLFVVDPESSLLTGYNFKYSTETNLKLFNVWDIRMSPSELLEVKTRPQNERVHSQGRVMYDRSVYYKYVNPNLIAVATITKDSVHKHVLSVYLIDGITGLVVFSVSHKKASGPVHVVHSENWLVYSYFNERFRRTEIVAAELYEGHIQSNSTVFSSNAVAQLPQVESQAYILPVFPMKMAVTLTERGITNKNLLVALSNGGVMELPWLWLQPRFPGVPCGPEESCVPYMPEIPVPSEAFINYNQSVARIRDIEVAPARLESTCHVLVHGLDIFYVRVAPSKTFDVLKEDFDHKLIVIVLIGLVVASYVTKLLAAKKMLKQAWK